MCFWNDIQAQLPADIHYECLSAKCFRTCLAIGNLPQGSLRLKTPFRQGQMKGQCSSKQISDFFTIEIRLFF